MAVSTAPGHRLDHRNETVEELMSSPLTSADYCGLGGWYWYCEEHDAHGIADSEDEAEFVLDAHAEYHELQGDGGCTDSGMRVVFYQPEDESGDAPVGG